MFTVSPDWKAAYPGASVGVLVVHGVANPSHCPPLDRRKEELETELRARLPGYDRAALKALPVLRAYEAYFRRFNKTYHVQLQLESLLFKGKPIPRVATLVEAMFMAELKNLLLTAGHDLDAVQTPVGVDVALGHERYQMLNGQEQGLKPGDMFIHDSQSVISSVIYGPDQRTRITAQTQRVLFTVYAVPGIAEQLVWDHLRDIQAYVLLIAPRAQVHSLQVYGTEG